MIRLVAGPIVAALLLAAAAADAAGLDSLAGTYLPQGEVRAEGELDAAALAAGMIEISPAGGDFRIRMPQVTGDAVEMRDLEFRSVSRPGVFKCTRSGDPLAGQHLQWARLGGDAGDTLVLYDFSVAAAGGYEEVIYRLGTEDGMLRLRVERQGTHGRLGSAEMSLKRQ